MAMSSALKKKLASAQKNWGKAKKRAETEKTGFEEIADGRYLARLVGAEINESQSSSRLQVMWEYRIVEGDYKGQTKRDYDGLESEDNLMYLARKLAKYGYEAPDDLEQVDALLTQIVKEKPLVRVRLKTKGGSDFQNVYIDAVYDKSDEDEALADAAGSATEDEAEEEEADAEAETEEAEADTEAEAEAEDEGEAETEEEDEVEITPGLAVVVTLKSGDNVAGEVLEILADEGKVRVKTEGGKVVRVAMDALSLPPDDEADETEAEEEDDTEDDVPESPVPAKGKKPAPAPPAPAKKPAPAAKPAPAPAKKGKK